MARKAENNKKNWSRGWGNNLSTIPSLQTRRHKTANRCTCREAQTETIQILGTKVCLHCWYVYEGIAD